MLHDLSEEYAIMTRYSSVQTITRGLVCWLAVILGTAPAHAGLEATAATGATVQPKGPRAGEPGKLYLNVEGKNNGEAGAYASFAVLDFRLAKPAAPVSKVKGLELVLVQSIARFSKEGTVKVYLAADAAKPLEPLKFDLTVPGGVGDQLGARYLLGEAKFMPGKTGEVNTINLTPTFQGEVVLRDRLAAGEPIRVVFLPVDDDVAATYFGASHEKQENRPKLVIDVAP